MLPYFLMKKDIPIDTCEKSCPLFQESKKKFLHNLLNVSNILTIKNLRKSFIITAFCSFGKMSREEIIKVTDMAKRKMDCFILTHELEETLRHALKNAIASQHRETVVYVQKVLAQFYSMKDDFDKAEIMYKFILENLKLMGKSKCDFEYVNTNLQLAVIAGNKDDHTIANQGFEWCITKLRPIGDGCKQEVLSKGNNNGISEQNLKLTALLSSALEQYGIYLHRNGINPQGMIAMLEALDYAKAAHGPEHIVVMVLHNDVATMKMDMCLHNEALEDAWAAVKIADKNQSKVSAADRAIYYCNLGCIYSSKRDWTNATEALDKSWQLAVKCRDSRLKTNIASVIARYKYDLADAKSQSFWPF